MSRPLLRGSSAKRSVLFPLLAGGAERQRKKSLLRKRPLLLKTKRQRVNYAGYSTRERVKEAKQRRSNALRCRCRMLPDRKTRSDHRWQLSHRYPLRYPLLHDEYLTRLSILSPFSSTEREGCCSDRPPLFLRFLFTANEVIPPRKNVFSRGLHTHESLAASDFAFSASMQSSILKGDSRIVMALPKRALSMKSEKFCIIAFFTLRPNGFEELNESQEWQF